MFCASGFAVHLWYTFWAQNDFAHALDGLSQTVFSYSSVNIHSQIQGGMAGQFLCLFWGYLTGFQNQIDVGYPTSMEVYFSFGRLLGYTRGF